jgi:hypothetical protein
MAEEAEKYDGMKVYRAYTGEGEEPSENTYEVQVRKSKGGKYQNRMTTNKEVQAHVNYDAINIGAGYTKRMLLNGKVYKRHIGY